MNPRLLVRVSNVIGVASIVLLLYWTFIFTCIEVFELKIFRKNLAETFHLSVLGILALMFGALILNIMFNLTRIAERNQEEASDGKVLRRWCFAIVLSLPIIAALLLAGDYYSSYQRKRMLIGAANALLEQNQTKIDSILHYSFNERWIVTTAHSLQLISSLEKNFPEMNVIVRDSVEGTNAFLTFRKWYGGTLNDTIAPVKRDFVMETTPEERIYLHDVFDSGNSHIRFSAHDGHYELYYPVSKNGKTMVLYFSDYERYGKIGSY